MSDRHIRRSGSDYTEAFLSLLPQGQAWPKHAPDSVLVQAITGLCEYWGFVDGRAADLLETRKRPAPDRRAAAGLGAQLGPARSLLHRAADHRRAPVRAGAAHDDAGRAEPRVLHRGRGVDRLPHHDHRISRVRRRARPLRRQPRLRRRLEPDDATSGISRSRIRSASRSPTASCRSGRTTGSARRRTASIGPSMSTARSWSGFASRQGRAASIRICASAPLTILSVCSTAGSQRTRKSSSIIRG